MIKDNELLAWGCRGIIPGPQEDEDTFLKRATACIQQEGWEEAAPITLSLFGFSIDWVPLHYSNKNLPFWEGAATWIGEEYSIQLREGFKKGRYLGYQRSEVLAHEAVHAARMAFNEPQFEEALAYRTAKSGLRKWIGPIFRKPWESLVFILSLGAIPLGYLWIPLFFLSLLGIRLLMTQWALQQCLKKLPLFLVVCLTDKEIWHFSRLPLSRIHDKLKKDPTLRGRYLFLLIRLKLTSH